MQTAPSINWGRETSPRPCISRNAQNLPRIRSLLRMVPISQNDQPQRLEKKFLAQTVRTDGQSLSHTSPRPFPQPDPSPQSPSSVTSLCRVLACKVAVPSFVPWTGYRTETDQ